MRCTAYVCDTNALSAVVPAGMARMRHTLQALQARAQAAMALADNGTASLVQTLSGLLPPLANSGMCCYLLCFIIKTAALLQLLLQLVSS